MNLAKMRLEYETAGLSAADLSADPIEQFTRWLDDAVRAEVYEPNAMVVSTVDGDGRPSSRFVLLKGVTARGFEFFTNYESNKSSDLAACPDAALTFGWLGLHRQVNITGPVAKTSAEDSDRYWAQRTRGSQLGAWASAQSTELADRGELLRRYAEVEARFDDEVPRPPNWGGWRLAPLTIEFWQGRQNRLHDRLRYVGTAAAGWDLTRLSP